MLRSDSEFIYDSALESSSVPVVLHGLSFGSIFAIHVASNKPVKHLVLEGSITNVEDWVDYSFVSQACYDYQVPKVFGYMIKPFMKIKPAPELMSINNELALAEYDGSLLMLSGEKDWETPPELSEKLYKSARELKHREFHIIKGMRHLNVLTNDNVINIYKSHLAEAFTSL